MPVFVPASLETIKDSVFSRESEFFETGVARAGKRFSFDVASAMPAGLDLESS